MSPYFVIRSSSFEVELDEKQRNNSELLDALQLTKYYMENQTVRLYSSCLKVLMVHASRRTHSHVENSKCQPGPSGRTLPVPVSTSVSSVPRSRLDGLDGVHG